MGAICSSSDVKQPEKPLVPPLSLEAFCQLKDNGALILDWRSYNTFHTGSGFIPGSLILQSCLSHGKAWCEFFIPKNTPLILVLGGYLNENEHIQTLLEWGYTVQGSLNGGFEAWVSAGYPVHKIKVLPYNNFESTVQAQKAKVVDVRHPDNWEEFGHIKDAQCIIRSEILTRYNEIPRDQPLYVHCISKQFTVTIYSFLLRMGFTNLVGFIQGVDDFNYEVEWAAKCERIRIEEMMKNGGTIVVIAK